MLALLVLLATLKTPVDWAKPMLKVIWLFFSEVPVAKCVLSFLQAAITIIMAKALKIYFFIFLIIGYGH
jgi:hypothetical protein